jgi:hypothetical protein
MSDSCPLCGCRLQEILIHSGETPMRGVRCSAFLCQFNLADQRCPQCGGDVVKAKHPELGRFEVTCAKAHTWNCY